MSEKAALLESIHPAASAVYSDAGLTVIEYPKSISSEDLGSLVQEVKVLGVRSGPNVSAEMMSDNLQVIGVYGVGTNHIARESDQASGELGADGRGIAIFNSAHENTRSVAELVIGSSFALLRQIARHNRRMHDGVWTKEDGTEIRGKTMGIIGYGAIGAQVSVMAEALGMDVVYYDRDSRLPHGRAQTLESMEAVLATADIVTLHVPGGKSNHHMINANTIALMKPGSYIVNAARADLVDYNALLEALEGGQLAGAAVDVYSDDHYQEPAKRGDPFDHPLRKDDRVILLPHIGGSTLEAQQNIGHSVALKTLVYLATGNSVGSVNMPPLPLEALAPGTSRLLHIHRDQPGVLAILTSLVADQGLNVVGAIQKTKGDLGYAAIDVLGEISSDILAVAGTVKATRRVRAIYGHLA